MADGLVCVAPRLIICTETEECDVIEDDCCATSVVVSNLLHHRNNAPIDRSEHFFLSSLPSEESVELMIATEKEHMPRNDYLRRLQCADLDLAVRKEAIDWIWKANAVLNFQSLSLFLSINYLDRFLSIHEMPRCRPWTVHLIAVACLSLAAKMDEAQVPHSIDLQVGGPDFLFDGKTIQRMELLVLTSLKWRMCAITPFSFLDYFLSKIVRGQFHTSSLFSQSVHLILNRIRVVDFLAFKSSEIAAAAAILVWKDIHTVDIDKVSRTLKFVETDRVLDCMEMMKDFAVRRGGKKNVGGMESNSSSSSSISITTTTGSAPQSPIGVLDAAACGLSKTNPDLNKRRKLGPHSSESQTGEVS